MTNLTKLAKCCKFVKFANFAMQIFLSQLAKWFSSCDPFADANVID